MREVKLFRTRDIALAAFLETRGHSYRAVRDEAGRVWFRFRTTRPADTLAFNLGELVSAADYSRAIYRAREWIWMLRRDQENGRRGR